MIVKVEQKHLDEGYIEDPGACPIALALNETLGGTWAVYQVEAIDEVDDREIKLPQSAQRFIRRWDMTDQPYRGGRFPSRPFGFRITRPS